MIVNMMITRLLTLCICLFLSILSPLYCNEPVSSDVLIKTEGNTVELANEFIKLIVNHSDQDFGRFSLETTGGHPNTSLDDHQLLIFGRPIPWTSYTTIRINTANMIITIPALVYFIFYANYLMTFLFGDQYIESANVFRILILMFLIQMFGYGYILRGFGIMKPILPANILKTFLSISLGIPLIYFYYYKQLHLT